MLRRCAACLLLLLPFAPATLQAHADIDVRIAAVSAGIAAAPDDPERYLKRAELHRLHRDWPAALADYRKAQQLAADNADTEFLIGRMWLEADRPELARPPLDRFLAHRPEHANALLVRARVLARLGEAQAAADDLSAAIRRVERPTPEMYLERARLLAAQGPERVDAALRGIDEGMDRLGPMVTLVAYAVQLEADRKHYDAALARIDALPATLQGTPLWTLRRADILASAGREAQAADSYRAALQAIEALPPARRRTSAMQALEQHARRHLATMQTD